MSAAEKLKALEADARRMSAGHGHAFVPHSLIDALPQIVALVEAAQPYVDNAAPHEQLFNGQDLRNFQRLDDALAALDEALS